MKKRMTMTDLAPAEGARTRSWRVGRGVGSGNGKTAGAGQKGQKARGKGSSYKGEVFEGGQMPIVRRLPKFGFKAPFSVSYKAINVGSLEAFPAGSVVDIDALKGAGLADGRKKIKILGGGKLTKKITVRADAFSESAVSAIKAAGGAAETLG